MQNQTNTNNEINIDSLIRLLTFGNVADNLQSLLDISLNVVLKEIKFNYGAIFLVNDSNDKAEIKSSVNLPENYLHILNTIDINEYPNSLIFKNGEIITSNNYSEINPEISKNMGFNAIASIPILSNYKVIGLINLISKDKHVFSKNEMKYFTLLSQAIGICIAKILLSEKTEKYIKENNQLVDSIHNFINKELITSGSKIQSIYRAMDSEIFHIDINGSIISYKESIDVNYIETPAGFSNDSLLAFFPMEVAENILLNVGLAIETKETGVFGFKTEIGGIRKFFEARCSYVNSHEAILIVNEITNKKLIEESLIESNERLSSTVESLDDLLLIIDKDGILIDSYYSKKEGDAFHLPEEYLGKVFKEIFPVPLEENIEAILNNEDSSVRSANFDYNLIIENQEKWFTANLTKRKDGYGNFGGTTIVIHDITERIEHQKSIERYSAELEIAHNSQEMNITNQMELIGKLESIVNEKNEILGIVAHDLLNPLTGIVNINEILKIHHDKLSSSEIEKYCHDVNSISSRMICIINELLEKKKKSCSEDIDNKSNL